MKGVVPGNEIDRTEKLGKSGHFTLMLTDFSRGPTTTEISNDPFSEGYCAPSLTKF